MIDSHNGRVSILAGVLCLVCSEVNERKCSNIRSSEVSASTKRNPYRYQ